MSAEELTTLVGRARAGDVDAYGQIVRRFQDMAYGYAYSLLGDFHLAEDAAQEAFVQAYRDLAALNESAAFPGWFRRIVFKYADRLRRSRRATTVPLDRAAEAHSSEQEPSRAAEHREMADKVLEAIQALPDDQRTATTLFYINGYSQKDIAEFLEVPVTTVNNRLAASRKRLKQRMLTMVADELKSHALPEEFPQRIRDLLSLSRPLEIEGHPVRDMWSAFRECFADCELVDLPEICPRDISSLRPDQIDQYVYWVDEQRMLRPELTSQLFDHWYTRGGGPCRFVTVGRVFRAGHVESRTSLEVHHQAKVLWVAEGIGHGEFSDMMDKAIGSLLPGIECRFGETFSTRPVPNCRWLEGRWRDQWLHIAAGGVVTDEWIARGNLDPSQFGGVNLSFGLERTAQVRLDLDDVRKLWQPPYVPG